MATKRIRDLAPLDRAKLTVRTYNKPGSTIAEHDAAYGQSIIRNVKASVGTRAAASAQKDAFNLAPTKSHSKGPTMAQQAAAKDAFNLGKK